MHGAHHVPDHAVQEAAALHLEAQLVRAGGHHVEARQRLVRVHPGRAGVRELREVVPPQEQLRRLPALRGVPPLS